MDITKSGCDTTTIAPRNLGTEDTSPHHAHYVVLACPRVRSAHAQTTDKRRHNYCEIVCKHAGTARRKESPKADTKCRQRPTQQVSPRGIVLITRGNSSRRVVHYWVPELWSSAQSRPSMQASAIVYTHDTARYLVSFPTFRCFVCSQTGCPFKLAITWRVDAPGPRITSVS